MSASAIAPRFVPKVWGSKHLEPWFSNRTEPTGEVWFPAGDLLIKFLFTTENLSVQVHPGDEYAAREEKSRGKTEMWHILRAGPFARVALGFREPIEPERLKAGAHSGELVDDLQWFPAQPGDTFFTPAGTVHAIGAGLVLCEIQQHSDVTYRIFDYGRPRELHLEHALRVSDLGCHAGPAEPRDIDENTRLLVNCEYFRTERWRVEAPRELRSGTYAIILSGTGSVDAMAYRAGTVWDIGNEDVRIEPSTGTELLVTGES